MATFRLLYLDDNPDHLEKYGRWLSRTWDQLYKGIKLEVSTYSKPEDAMTALRSQEWHLFVADVLFGKSRAGLECIAEARADNSGLPIIALSIGNGAYEPNSYEAGADEFISKGYLADLMNPDRVLEYLSTKMISALRRHGREPALTDLSALDVNEDDLDLAAVIDVIGRVHVTNCTIRALGRNCSRIKPHFVRPGLSGAAVLRVDCELEVEDGHVPERQNLLLKLSSDRGQLSDEVTKDLSRFPDELFVKYNSDQPVSSGTWYAIAANFREASILPKWVSEQSSTNPVFAMLQDLFFKAGLAQIYKNSVVRADERPTVALSRTLLTPSRKSRIRQALKEYADLAKKYDPNGQFDPKTLDTFIVSRRLGNLDEEKFPKGIEWCLSHGDLHSRNILVTNKGPRLVDAANVGELPWPADLARLAVDLLVSGLDNGDASHEWTNVSQWFDAVQAFNRNDWRTLLVDTGTSTSVMTAVGWLRQNLHDLVGGHGPPRRPEWQFLLCVAIEFMRCSYRYQDLPSPKRVLSLLAACDAIREAEASILNE